LVLLQTKPSHTNRIIFTGQIKLVFMLLLATSRSVDYFTMVALDDTTCPQARCVLRWTLRHSLRETTRHKLCSSHSCGSSIAAQV